MADQVLPRPHWSKGRQAEVSLREVIFEPPRVSTSAETLEHAQLEKLAKLWPVAATSNVASCEVVHMRPPTHGTVKDASTGAAEGVPAQVGSAEPGHVHDPGPRTSTRRRERAPGRNSCRPRSKLALGS